MIPQEEPDGLVDDVGFLFSVVEIEMEQGNDIIGTRTVLMTLGCSAQQAEGAIGSYLCRRSDRERARK
jgi:hypothetical protein